MPPTVKDSSTLSTATEIAEREPQNASQEISSAQPVTLQVPVTVNGARAVEGSQKREPFSENTNTVLVLINGAVIRLNTPVMPGQLLFLTNDRTRKEVVCQVVKSKNDRSASGYVELQFTEPVLGFWGMRFPGERQGVAVKSAALDAARKVETGPALPPIPKVTVQAKPERVAEATAPVAPAAKIAESTPEFKTEIKADARPSSKADFLAPSGGSEGLDNTRLQEQLSALLFAEQRQDDAKPVVAHEPVAKRELEQVAAKIFEIAAEPAARLDTTEEPVAAKPEAIVAAQPTAIVPVIVPAKSTATPTSSFEDEVVKIPAWLEPLARNASIPAPPDSEQSNDISGSNEDWASPEATTKPEATTRPEGTAKAAAPATIKSVTEESKRPAAPVFSKTLLDEGAAQRGKSQGSGKGMWMAIAAAVLAAAAGGGWYFRDSLAGLLPGQSAPEANVAAAALPAASGNSVAPATVSVPDSAKVDRTSSPSVKEEAPVKITSPAPGKVQMAAITERVPKAGSSSDASKSAENSAEAVQPENKKMGLGEVHLAKPKVGHAGKVAAGGEMEPALDASNQLLPGGESSLGAGFAESEKRPVAPTEAVRTGGDVKPARMISSVPPVYPAMAKSQHVSGDVKVDALIDATGRVTTMKVVSGPTLLHQAAMDALRQWKYQAASLDGQAVPMHLTVTIQFRLQ